LRKQIDDLDLVECAIHRGGLRRQHPLRKVESMSTRIAIVAGAGSGLGQATAVALHTAGITVIAVDRNEAGLKELPDAIHREVADATDPTAPGPLVDRIVTEVGTPDILVNTIGAYELGDALTTTAQTLRHLMDVNLGAALWLTQAVAPHMQQAGSGAIVHVAARQGVEPAAGVVAYAASKAALVHLIRLLDVELRPHGIRVNAVVPQVIATAKNKAMFPPEMLEGAVEPEAIADVIAFLVSEAAAPVSGAVVPTYGVTSASASG
jgi:NAD(P)-dependent dehydrogenase (short-subunit alcohol dehydrogenase family)